MEYYSVLKRKELSSHGKTWRNLKYILISESLMINKYICMYIYIYIFTNFIMYRFILYMYIKRERDVWIL